MKRERRAAERTEVEAEFAAALRHARFTLKSTPVMDGTWQRAAVEGDRGLKRSGRYVGYLDGHAAGFLQNFRTGEAASWKSE